MTTELMTTADVAAHTGLTVGAVRTRLHRKDMPASAGHAGQSPYWWSHTITKWAATLAPRKRRETRDR